MSATNTIIGGVLFVGAFQLGISALLPNRSFMTVYAMEYADGRVLADRQVHGTATGETGLTVIADWRVTVVGANDEAPSCQTVPGPDKHQGWSPYEPGPRDTQSFPLDVWVGDEGCAARLVPGKYVMFATWTPRDGSPPVWEKSFIEIPGPPGS